ncbi:MAG: SO_0444 family Cu/Zn efflux transporter [Muribaculaceae bacterium]|nr:SO_0444 family Cu/Zn efflux transporter [Muribaculaceae bacterium]
MEYQHIFHSFLHILNEMSPYVLLGFLIAGILHVFVNEATLTRHLSGNGWKSVVKAAAIGIPLPLCSCGVLPTAVSLRRQGASKAATTSFLIATPQTGVDSIAATYSLLGLPFALIRPIAALTGALFGGLAVGKLDPDRREDKTSTNVSKEERLQQSFGKKFKDSVKYGFFDMVDSMGQWLVIGLVIATLITIFVPDSFFVGLRQYPLIAMIAVVLIAIPMYICATGSIPIAMSLMLKGLSPGVAFVMLMAGPAANFASILILDKTQGRKATAIYVTSVVITAIAFGLLIDFLLPSAWFTISAVTDGHNAHMHMGWFETACSVTLVLLLLFSFFKKFISAIKFKNITQTDMTKTYKIEGMNCSHCKASVEKAITGLQGVDTVEVDLSSGLAKVSGDVEDTKITEAVRMAGFDISAV